MKTYRVSARTQYDYSTPASYGHHLARLMPGTWPGQTVDAAHLTIKPHPSVGGTQHDFFGNQVQWFSLDETHDSLLLNVEAQVRVARPPSLLEPHTSWQKVAQDARQVRSLAPDSPAHFLRPTARTQADAALQELAQRFFSQERSIKLAIDALNGALHADLAYDGEATSVETTAAEALAIGAGVCQDFAHIMIAACRAVGLPARYVSGYLQTVPPPGQPRLEGADAMHAWVSVWMGETVGWIDLDPTNGCRVGEDHIAVAVGRDYQDVAPVRGEVVGGGTQTHAVAVDVIEVGQSRMR